ncbi:hypothetical protein E2562_026715 [Oryza meyeriana var. granulata]|uniref:Uncharacterized protein n=1 Tax=Oryza meyeriana var. granulata TaxID=110450 RepID=A0A6G1EZ46_9ORYZ|nr:hypothetical protein E2562_026715 [Oryza meyeriana var. granulata]
MAALPRSPQVLLGGTVELGTISWCGRDIGHTAAANFLDPRCLAWAGLLGWRGGRGGALHGCLRLGDRLVQVHHDDSTAAMLGRAAVLGWVMVCCSGSHQFGEMAN